MLPVSAKGEGVGLDARIKKSNFDRPVGDRAVLAHKLVEPLSVHNAQTFGVNIRAMIVRRWFTVDRHSETDLIMTRCRT